MPRRWGIGALLVAAGIIGGLVALGGERGAARLFPAPTPVPAPTATPAPTAPPVVVERATSVPTAAPTSLPSDRVSQQLGQLQQQVAQQAGLLLVSRAERHLALASNSLRENDLVKVNQELVAAQATLDRAFEQVSEDLKQAIDSQRREVGRVRADLQVAPELLDERLRAMQDQLLVLAVP